MIAIANNNTTRMLTMNTNRTNSNFKQGVNNIPTNANRGKKTRSNHK
jgi:hypothetical protein